MNPFAIVLASISLSVPSLAQTEGQSPPATTPAPTDPAKSSAAFTPEQLEQIVAPIALHPDTLVAQIFMAATYPLEIVEAARWVQKNSSLKGKQLEEALKNQDWDPAVKVICGLPAVLKQMNDNLDWTQDLGDAFLGQKKELMDTVQKMRKKALEAGTLKSTEEQKVTEEGDIIIIQSASPEVVYVPTYSPTVVYGSSWYYPSYYYPPMYAPYPPGAPLFSFGLGLAWGAAIWGDCNWGGSDIDIDIDHHNEFNRNTDRNPDRNKLDKAGATDRAGRGKQSFKHDPAHRKGANYRNPQTAQQFGGSAGSNRVSRDQARGRPSAGTSGGRGTGPAASRPSATPRPTPSGGAGSTRATQRPSSSTGSRSSASSSGRSSALSGSRSPSFERSASSRGSASRGSSGARSGGRASGGRGGGGRGGGRGGGGRR